MDRTYKNIKVDMMLLTVTWIAFCRPSLMKYLSSSVTLVLSIITIQLEGRRFALYNRLTRHSAMKV